MVLLLDQKIPGESIFLFAPEGGVPLSQAHPFRVARFKNATGGLLERGPIAFFSDGAFVGQGVIEPLPDAATATVPFALERSLAVEHSRETSQQGGRVVQIESGVLTLERETVSRATYKVKNGGAKEARLLVKYPRQPGWRLHDPPPGTEDNTGTGSALVPVDVPGKASHELVIDERISHRQATDWMSPQADDAVKAYLLDGKSRGEVVRGLTAAWAIRATLLRAQDERTRLSKEQAELERMTEETRENLRALNRVRTADDLRLKLTDRLERGALRLDQITKSLVEIDLAISEQSVRFRDAVQAVKLLPG
jgi:hypothetical protein